VDRLPFAPGQRIVAVGESTTDDLLSWFEILRRLLDLRRPADRITLTNMAVSGQTTTRGIRVTRRSNTLLISTSPNVIVSMAPVW